MNGTDVARIRGKTGLAQPAFARAIGVSEKTVRNWERGAAIPEMAQLFLGCVQALVDADRTVWPSMMLARLEGKADG